MDPYAEATILEAELIIACPPAQHAIDQLARLGH